MTESCELCSCHMTESCELYCCHMNGSCELCSCHMTESCELCSCHMTESCELCSCHMTESCELCSYHMTIATGSRYRLHYTLATSSSMIVQGIWPSYQQVLCKRLLTHHTVDLAVKQTSFFFFSRYVLREFILSTPALRP